MPNYSPENRRPRARLLAAAVLSAVCVLCAVAAPAQRRGGPGARRAIPPVTKQGLLRSLQNIAPLSPGAKALARREMLNEIKQYGADFRMTEVDEAELRAAGAPSALIDAVRANYRPRTDVPQPGRAQPGRAQPGGLLADRERPRTVPTPSATPTPTPTPRSNLLPPLPPTRSPPPPLVPGRSGDGYLALRVQALMPETAAARGVTRGRGLLLQHVRPGSVAAAAGLRAGDVVTAVNGRSVSDVGEFWSSIRVLRPGSLATLTIWRAGRSDKVRAGITDFPLYLELVGEGEDRLRRGEIDEAIRLLRRALDLDPAEHEAYPRLFTALLYYKSDWRAADEVMRRVVEVGGPLFFRVTYDNCGGAFERHCFGDLFVSQEAVAFVADDGVERFRAARAELRSATLSNSGSSRKVFTIEAGRGGAGAPGNVFGTDSPLSAAGGEKFSATGLDPNQRRQMRAEEALIIVRMLNLILKR